MDDDRGFFSWSKLKEKYDLDEGQYLKCADLLKSLPADWRKLLRDCRMASTSNSSFSANAQLGRNSVELTR